MDEVHRIILETVNTDKVDQLNAALDVEKEKLQSLVEQLKQGAITQGMFDAAAVKTAGSIVNLNRQIDSMGGMSRDTQLRILELGRAAQDFAQGGFAGIVNNIERLVGGAGPAAGLLTILGTALLVTKDYWKEWFKVFEEGRQKIPETADKIEGLTEKIKKNKDAIEDLKKHESLNAIELDKYKKLVDEVKAAEEELGKARELKKLREAPTRAEQKRGAQFQEALEEFGGVDKLMEAIQATGLGGNRAREMVLGAGRGEFNEVENIRRTVPAMGQLLQLDPRRLEKLEANRKRERKRAMDLEDEAEKRRDARNRETDELNKMGLEGEDLARRITDQQARQEKAAFERRALEGPRHAYQREKAIDEANRRAFEASPVTQAMRPFLQQQQAARQAELAAQAAFANALTGEVQASQMRTNIWRRATQRLQQNNATGGIP